MESKGKIICTKDYLEGEDKWGIPWRKKLPLTLGKVYDVYSISHFWGCYLLIDDDNNPQEYQMYYFITQKEHEQQTREDKLNTLLQ